MNYKKKAALPAIAVATVINGGEVSTQSIGVTRADSPAEVSGRTVFEAASLSKPVFAYIVLKLVQQGKIDLDRPLCEYCAYGPNVARIREHPNYKKLTARMVLSHQAGLPNEFSQSGPPAFIAPAGERFNYSGEAFCFLAEVIETHTGRSLESLAQEEFAQLGMKHSSFIPPTGCSYIRLQDTEELTEDTVQKIIAAQSDKHCQLNIIVYRDRLFIAERTLNGVQITEKLPTEVGASVFQQVMDKFAPINERPALWSKPIAVEAQELPLIESIVAHLPIDARYFAIGHRQDGSVNPEKRFYYVHSGGSLYTSSSDYAKFLKACTNDSFVKEAMFSPALSSLADKDDKAIEKGVPSEVLASLSWGLGMGLQTSADGTKVAFHWGDNQSGRTLCAINLSSGNTVVCFTNSANGPRVFSAIAGPIVGDLSSVGQWLSIREELPMIEEKERIQDQKKMKLSMQQLRGPTQEENSLRQANNPMDQK